MTRINSGLSVAALTPGLALPAAVKSVEDHGYTLTFGIKVRIEPLQVVPARAPSPFACPVEGFSIGALTARTLNSLLTLHPGRQCVIHTTEVASVPALPRLPVWC